MVPASALRRLLCSTPIDPAIHKSPVTSLLWKERAAAQRAAGGTDGTTPGALAAKAPSDSAVTATYAFGSNAELRDMYVNPFGGPKFGVLFEDMDALAGNVAFKHCDDGNPDTRPPLLVTASVDKIGLLETFGPIETDLALSGKVAWVGRSSMQIRIELRELVAEGAPSAEPKLAADFTFVARDRGSGKATPIAPLTPESEEEQALFDRIDGEARAAKAARAERSADERLEAAAVASEQVHSLLRDSQLHLSMPSLAPSDAVLTRDTLTHNALICQPQQRNTAGRIFGGFLMRRAFELAFADAYLFAGSRPHFRQVEHVSFRAPVEVGALLRLKAAVVLSQPERPCPLVTVDVEAVVAQPEERRSVTSNTFTFTFALASQGEGAAPPKRVLPATEEEAQRQLEVIQLLGERAWRKPSR